MKEFSCQDMGGVCDALIKGETASEVSLRAMSHYRETNDDAHRAKTAEIEASTPEMTHAWREKFQEQFDAAPDLEVAS